MVGVVRPCIGHVIKHLLAVQTQPLRNMQQTNGTESTLGVDVQALSLASTHVNGKLTCHRESMADLRFSGTELPEQLGNCARLDSPAEEGVEVLRPGSYMHEFVAASMYLCCTLEAERYYLLGYRLFKYYGSMYKVRWTYPLPKSSQPSVLRFP